MASEVGTTVRQEQLPLPISAEDLPLLYEDEEEGEMGEANIHVLTEEISRNGLKSHLAEQRHYRVFSNMNLYYHPKDPRAYVSPDTMLVEPFRELGEDVSSYRIGVDGPAPKLTLEVLSARTAQQRDLDEKVIVYAKLGVQEYILVDVTGVYLPERLLLKRLQPDRSWKDEQDPDGGVTSRLGFRLIIDTDGHLRMLNAATGARYARPNEAEAEARARRQAEERMQAEAEALGHAEQRMQAEAEARRQAEERRQTEAEARRQAEERIRALEEELRRLRGTAPESENL